VSIHESLHRLATAWKIFELHKFLHNISESPYIELGQLAKLKGAVSAATASLDTLTAVILWCHTSGSAEMALSDWTSPSLTTDQKYCVALEAYENLQIWSYLSAERSVGLPVDKAVTGEMVSLMSGKKIAAYGILADQPCKKTVFVGFEEKEIKLTPKQAVVTIQKIVLGGLIVKTHKLSLQQMGALPFSVIVPLKSLCTRNAEEPHMVPPQLLAAMPKIPEYVALPKTADDVLSQNVADSDSDADQDEEGSMPADVGDELSN